jgi:hypothetical protein
MIRIIAQAEPLPEEDKTLPGQPEAIPDEQVAQAVPQAPPLPTAPPADEHGPPPPVEDILSAEEEPEPLPVTGKEEEVVPAGELPPAYDPGKEFKEVVEPTSWLDEVNETLDKTQKITFAMTRKLPLRIVYTTLEGHTTERTIDPDLRFRADTGNELLVAWCRLRNDWRAFIIDRIDGQNIKVLEA